MPKLSTELDSRRRTCAKIAVTESTENILKFQADREVMHEAVSFAVRLISPKPNSPQASGVLIVAGENSVELSVFDFEVSAKARFAAAVDTPGQVLVQGKLMADIVGKLPGQTISVEMQDNRVVISAGSSKFTLTSMVMTDGAVAPEFPASIGSVSASEFSHAVSQVSPAASKEEVMAALTTVSITVQNKLLSLLATDKFRVAHKTLAWNGTTTDKEVLVPARVLQEISKTFANVGQLEIGLDESGREMVGFRSADKSVTTATVKAKFPAVLPLFPEAADIDHFAVVRTHDLLDATRRIALVVDKEKPIRYRFVDGEVVLETIAGDVAEGSESVTSSLTGESISVSLKPQFVTDVLTGIDAENVQIVFTKNKNNPGKPGPVQVSPMAEKQTIADFRYLLQPNLLHV